jgi:hypothetical protein
MFESNTKVIVLASSSSKNIGPKYGSVGYVVSSGSPIYIQKLPIGNGVAISLSDILFIRYGFGKERAAERRLILNIFPIFTKPLQKGSTISKEMNKLLRNFSKYEFNEEPWFGIKASQVPNPSKLIVAVLAPLKSTGEDLVSCSEMEFEAWFNSYARNVAMTATLSKVCAEPYYSRLPFDADHKELLRLFKNYSNSKTDKKTLIKHVVDNEVARKAFIRTIVLTKSIIFGQSSKSAMEKSLKVASMFGGSSNHLHTAKFLNFFIRGAFSGELPYIKKHKVISATPKSKVEPKEAIFKQLIDTIDFMKSKASKIEKGPHGS